jgi:hypothetical protein
MAISLDRLENPVIFFGPVLRHHAGRGLRAPRPPPRRWAWQPFLRSDHPHLNLDLLAIDHTEVFVEFDGFAVDFAVQGFRHDSSPSLLSRFILRFFLFDVEVVRLDHERICRIGSCYNHRLSR